MKKYYYKPNVLILDFSTKGYVLQQQYGSGPGQLGNAATTKTWDDDEDSNSNNAVWDDDEE